MAKKSVILHRSRDSAALFSAENKIPNEANFLNMKQGDGIWSHWHGGKTADWLLISRVFLLSADLSAAAQQRLKNYEIFTSVTQQIRQEMQK